VSDACATVLIAVEEPMVARILEHKLRREGHQVRIARNRDQLDAALSADDVDVLLLAAALHDGAALASPPRAGWFLVTGRFDADSSVHAAMNAGAAGVVRMPFKPTAVAGQVATLLSLVPS
jgi:DNA-binding response OmpR family regulator